jgi:hypothetical protein
VATTVRVGLLFLGICFAGEWAIHRTLVLCHRMSSIIPPDPRYDSELHLLLFVMGLVWFFLSLVLAGLLSTYWPDRPASPPALPARPGTPTPRLPAAPP